jgi:lactoylglutathione lyase
MQSKLFRITLNSSQPELLLRFYSVLGFHFSQKQVDKGSLAWLGQLGEMALEVYGIKETFSGRSPNVQLSFQVAGIESIIEKVRDLKLQIMMEPLQSSIGTIAIVMDPDGRSIELIQK